jgi:hypothetical protein
MENENETGVNNVIPFAETMESQKKKSAMDGAEAELPLLEDIFCHVLVEYAR